MLASLAERNRALLPLVLLGGLAIGVASGSRPTMPLAFAVAIGALLLAFRAPTANLVLLVFLTAVVPYGLQNRFGVGGGVNSPGLLLSDLLLLAGLGWALLTLLGSRLPARELVFAVGIAVFLGVAILQFVHGVRTGGDRSRAGAELRALLGFGALLMALPLLAHTRSRERLLRALLGVAIALGAWGLIQWAGHFTFGAAGDVGVRSGVRLTTSGTGQLQGGEYGFPVAIVTCVSVLLTGNVRSTAGRLALWAAIVLNGASCLLTFERSFWLATLLGLAVVVLRARPGQRAKALVVVPLALLVSVAVLAFAAPATLTTAKQRLLSVGSYSSDDSVRYRLAESRVVLDAIHAHPLVGSGLAASVHWGQPWAQVPPKSYTFSHDGYLWIAWKLGLPASILLVALCASALVLRRPRGEAGTSLAVRQGAQGALAGVLLATLTFPSLSQLSITPVVGLLLALAVSRAVRAEAA